MAGSVNKVILIGNVGADPEIRRTQNGNAIANLSIATSESWRDRNSGERKEKTEWHKVVVYNEGLAKVCEQYVKKGSKLYIEGQLQTKKWQDRDGVDRYTTEIALTGFNSTLTMLDGRQENGGGNNGRREDRDDDRGGARPRGGDNRSNGGGRPNDFGGGGYGGGGSGGNFSRDLDDDIPFEMSWR